MKLKTFHVNHLFVCFVSQPYGEEYEILVPRPGMESMPPTAEGRHLHHWTDCQRSPCLLFFMSSLFTLFSFFSLRECLTSNIRVQNTNPLSSGGNYFSWFVIWSLFSFMEIWGLRKSILNVHVSCFTFLMFSSILSDLKSSRRVFLNTSCVDYCVSVFPGTQLLLDVLGEEIKVIDKCCPHILGQPPRHWSGVNKSGSLAPQGLRECLFDPGL